MRTFVYRDATSQRFWNIELRGVSFTAAFGKVGSPGRSHTKAFANEEQARREHDRLIRDKLARGYRETAPPAPPAGPPSSLREALEAALVENPDDLATHAAYADHLVEQGDPRGEFIQVQLRLEDATVPARERKRLQQRERQLLDAHRREWLGEMAPGLLEPDPEDQWVVELYRFSETATFSFRRGWLDTLHVNVLGLPLARAMRHAPQLRLLKELVIAHPSNSNEQDVRPDDLVPQNESSLGICPLLAADNLGNVRRFQFGITPPADEYEQFACHERSRVLPDILRKMPKLEELRIFGNGFDLTTLFAMPMPHLRLLQVYHQNQVHRLQVLAENPTLGNLTHLLLHPHHIEWFGHTPDHADGYEVAQGYLPLSVVRPLLWAKNLPRLAHLRLRVSSLGNAGCEEVVKSGILRRLRTLDLRHGRITEQGAHTLAACPDLKNLEWLDLDSNSINEEAVAAVKATGVPVRIDNQHAEDEVLDDDGAEYWDEEAAYLSEGEFE